MFLLHLILLVLLIPFSTSASFKVKMSEHSPEMDIPFIKREEWIQFEPKTVTRIGKAVKYVLIHETSLFRNQQLCITIEDCKKDLIDIQYKAMYDDQDDIMYNFAIGGTDQPAVYEARGWDVYSAYKGPGNETNVSIAFIGEYTSTPPLPIHVILMRLLLEEGMKKGHIVPDYKIVPHEFNTSKIIESCVGDALYQSMGTWKNIRKI